MQFTRTSPITSQSMTRDLPITQDQYDRWQQGAYIQDAMPNLSAADREWLMTGTTGEDWDTVFDRQDESVDEIAETVAVDAFAYDQLDTFEDNDVTIDTDPLTQDT